MGCAWTGRGVGRTGSDVIGTDRTRRPGGRSAPGGRLCAALALGTALAACSGGTPDPARTEAARLQRDSADRVAGVDRDRETIFDLFRRGDDPNTTVEVNRFIWDAALDVLDFLPVEAVDPFTGVIVMGFGTPPGGSTPYRATIYVQDPALDARSLNVALATRAGPADAATQRAVEDAILTRARQLRIAAARL